MCHQLKKVQNHWLHWYQRRQDWGKINLWSLKKWHSQIEKAWKYEWYFIITVRADSLSVSATFSFCVSRSVVSDNLTVNDLAAEDNSEAICLLSLAFLLTTSALVLASCAIWKQFNNFLNNLEAFGGRWRIWRSLGVKGPCIEIWLIVMLSFLNFKIIPIPESVTPVEHHVRRWEQDWRKCRLRSSRQRIRASSTRPTWSSSRCRPRSSRQPWRRLCSRWPCFRTLRWSWMI